MVLKRKGQYRVLFVELKGSDVAHGYSQIASAIRAIRQQIADKDRPAACIGGLVVNHGASHKQLERSEQVRVARLEKELGITLLRKSHSGPGNYDLRQLLLEGE